jgi:hypothetical protein
MRIAGASKMLLFQPDFRYETIRLMKLKLADYVISRTKHLLRPDDKEYERIGTSIRRSAVRAATRCAKIGRNNDVQFNKSLKEFLAFFSVIAVNELGIKLGRRSDEELRNVYEKLIRAICEGPEPDPSLRDRQLTISGLITYKRSGFDHWFYGYWNADLEGMRVTPEDLKELESRQIPGPSGDYCGDASFILLVRVSRLGTAQSSIPPASVILTYDAAIKEEVDVFVRELKRIIK